MRLSYSVKWPNFARIVAIPHQWLILASDGLWERGVLTNQEIGYFLKDIEDPDEASNRLLHIARNPGIYGLKKPDGTDPSFIAQSGTLLKPTQEVVDLCDSHLLE